MSALDQALALYEGQDATFEEDLAAFVRTGRVYITPTCVLFAKAVPSHLDSHGAMDVWEAKDCDAWLIGLAAGDLGEFFRYAPYPLPWLVWARRGRLRKWTWERAYGHIMQETVAEKT
jgi:hypothetical protein